MKNLSIDAAIVPIVYHIVCLAQGVEVANTTSTMLPAEVDGTKVRCIDALTSAGYAQPITVDIYPA